MLAGLRHLLRLPQLRVLTLWQLTGITSVGVSDLIHAGQSIREVEAVDCPGVSSFEVTAAAQDRQGVSVSIVNVE